MNFTEQQLEQMIDQRLIHYTEAEVDWLVQQAEIAGYFAGREETRSIEAFFAFLRLIGLAWVEDAIRVANWTWQKLRGFWEWLTS